MVTNQNLNGHCQGSTTAYLVDDIDGWSENFNRWSCRGKLLARVRMFWYHSVWGCVLIQTVEFYNQSWGMIGISMEKT